MQAGDQYFGVRGARLVLFDRDGVGAPAVASWRRERGHEASGLDAGLDGGLASALSLAPAAAPTAPGLKTIDAQSLSARLQQGGVAPIDVGGSMQVRPAH